MQPLFSTMYQATEALGPSLDYFLRFIDPGESRCTDVETNPYATVLLPEPMDFWGACSVTETCRKKCMGVMMLFEEEKALAVSRKTASERGLYTTKTVTNDVESKLFVGVDGDAYTPFKILAMVELEDCSVVCGGAAAGISDGFAVEFEVSDNRDACVAVAGITDSVELRVQKYCLPMSLGAGAWQQQSEGWTVQGSGEFIDTVLQVAFSESRRGDTLVVLRDNTGSGMPGPERELVTVHPRKVQANREEFEVLYGTQQKVADRLAVMTLEEATAALGSSSNVALGVVAMYVLPGGRQGRVPWIFMRVETSESGTVDLCWPIDENTLLSSLGQTRPSVRKCGTNDVMTAIIDEGRAVVSLATASYGKAMLALIPTKGGRGSSAATACFLELRFEISGAVNKEGARDCYSVGKGFPMQSGIPGPWTARSSAASVPMGSSSGSAEDKKAAVTASGVVTRVSRVSSQNCLQPKSLDPRNELLVFNSGDPRSRTSWLSQSRITFDSDTGTGAGSSMSSMRARITVEVLLSCDVHSCAGCPPGVLQNLCYSAQRCSIEKCVGVVVNQRRPLCNAGAVLQKMVETGVAAMVGGWLVLTETYGVVMGLALLEEERQSIRLASLDSAFYDQVCTLKDVIGVSTAMVTSITGAAALSPAVQKAVNAGQLLAGNAQVCSSCSPPPPPPLCSRPLSVLIAVCSSACAAPTTC